MSKKVDFKLNTTSVHFDEVEDCIYMHIKLPLTYRWLVKEIKKALEKGKEYTVRLLSKVNKRTDRQNKLFWALITEIVMHQNGGLYDDEDRGRCYCYLLERFSCEYTQVMVKPDVVEAINRNGLNIKSEVLFRAARVLNSTVDKHGELWNYARLYYGTSDPEYSTVSFNNLIEGTFLYMAEQGLVPLNMAYYEEEYKKVKEKKAA